MRPTAAQPNHICVEQPSQLWAPNFVQQLALRVADAALPVPVYGGATTSRMWYDVRVFGAAHRPVATTGRHSLPLSAVVPLEQAARLLHLDVPAAAELLQRWAAPRAHAEVVTRSSSAVHACLSADKKERGVRCSAWSAQ